MRIVKPGRKQKGWTKECTCTGEGNGGGGCGAVLLVEQADLFVTSSHTKDETSNFITFRCISCGVKTDLKNVPGNIVEEISKEKNCFYNDSY